MNRWDNIGIPHKGWTLVDCIDLGEDLSEDENIKYEICEMCHNEKIRFVHILTHPEYYGEIHVGCVCAGKMTDDYITHKESEKRLQNRYKRKMNFLRKEWIRNQNGNWVLNYKGRRITAIARNGGYGFVYNGNWIWTYKGHKIVDFDTLKIAAFYTFDDE